MSAVGILDAAYVVFYHPLDDSTEWTQSEAWGGAADYGTGEVGNALNGVVTAPGFGAEAEFLSAAGGASYISAAALNGTQFVVVYRDGADLGHGTARVGTVSGTSIAFGAEAEFLSAGGASYISATALNGTQFVVAYQKASTIHGAARVGTVSGAAIAFGAEAEFLSANGAYAISAAALSATAFVVAYRDAADAGHGTSKVGTVSGTSIAFGAEAEFLSAGAASNVSAAALSATQFAVAYYDGADSGHGTARVGTVSGAAIAFGAEAEFLSAGGAFAISAAALSATAFVVVYYDGADGGHGTAKVGTVSGTTIAFGAEAEFQSAGAASWTSVAALSPTQFVAAYRDDPGSNHGKAKVGTVSGTSIAFGAAAEFLSADGVGYISAAALSVSQFVVAFQDGADSGHGTARVWQASAPSLAGTSGLYPTAVGATRVAAAMWAKSLTAGSSTVTVERGYRIDMTAATVSLGGTTAVWSGGGIAALMSSAPGGINDGLDHLLALDFENTVGTTWRLRTSLDGDPWADQGTQDSGTQAVVGTDTAPRLAVAAGEPGQWIDELVLWAGDKAAFALFAADELANLQDLADVFGAPMDQYEEYFGAPICWQATARMPDGSAWRDSGCGPCPPVVRVPKGATDVVVTDDGAPASPRIVEG